MKKTITITKALKWIANNEHRRGEKMLSTLLCVRMLAAVANSTPTEIARGSVTIGTTFVSSFSACCAIQATLTFSSGLAS